MTSTQQQADYHANAGKQFYESLCEPAAAAVRALMATLLYLQRETAMKTSLQGICCSQVRIDAQVRHSR